MTEIRLAALSLMAACAWLGYAYFRPRRACWWCGGKRRRWLQCWRCKGEGEIWRPGARLAHRARLAGRRAWRERGDRR